MSLRANCSSCGQKFNAPDNLAGKTIKCPKCGGRVSIGGNGTGSPGIKPNSGINLKPNSGINMKPNSGIKPTRPSAVPGKTSGVRSAPAPAKSSKGKLLLFV